jgi:7-cyano-7-deazaguanine synthase in queuosine biosynthesis
MTLRKKCVIVLSGGPDSATVAYWAKKQRYEIYPITFNYGQIAVKETESAKKIAETSATTKSSTYPPQKSLAVTSATGNSLTSVSAIIVPYRNLSFSCRCVCRNGWS